MVIDSIYFNDVTPYEEDDLIIIASVALGAAASMSKMLLYTNLDTQSWMYLSFDQQISYKEVVGDNFYTAKVIFGNKNNGYKAKVSIHSSIDGEGYREEKVFEWSADGNEFQEASSRRIND